MTRWLTSSLGENKYVGSRRAFVIGAISACAIGLLVSWLQPIAPAVADPIALKVQGADTLGNPVQVQTIPPGAGGTVQTPLAVSANSANTAQNVSLGAVANQTTYCTGFQVAGSGATAASVINVTLSPVGSGTMNYAVVVPAGVTTSITPLIVTFPTPLPANAVNTQITLSVPAFGAGNTNQTASIQGFRQ